MNTKTLRTLTLTAVAVALILAVLFTGIFGLSDRAANAEDNYDGYYYEGLKGNLLAQSYYRIIDELAKNGTLKTGVVNYNLENVLTQTEIGDFAEGRSVKIAVAFEAARDAYFMDNPDLFYVDIYKLGFGAGQQDGKYVAFINTGRADNIYERDFASKDDAENAIAEYEAALNAAVDAAKADSNEIVDQIKFVNKYIAEKTTYDYGALEGQQSGDDYHTYVNSAYGPLVKGKALCGGYAMAYKAVMDRLGIPCALIYGNVSDGNGGFATHMWNAVKVSELWYGVDVTWNDTENKLDKYTLVGDNFLSNTHYEEKIISSSNYELRYPVLRPFNYGVDEDEAGFKFKDEGYLLKDENAGDVESNRKMLGYVTEDMDANDTTMILTLGISYEGKDYYELAAEGKYISARYIYDEGAEVPASYWQSQWAYNKIMREGNLYTNDVVPALQGYTVMQNLNWSVYQIQFAIIDIAPDMEPSNFGTYSSVPDGHIIAVSDVYTNDAYDSYKPAPHIVSKTPTLNGFVDNFDPIDVTLVYSEKLELIDTKKEAGIRILSQHDNISEYAYVDNFNFDGEKTVSFRFHPSKQYSHGQESYTLTPTNLRGVKSQKVPDPTGYTFKRRTVVCPKVYNDGRYYMNVFGEPKFLAAENLSDSDFKDKNGQPVSGNQRSQLMLVVNEPSKKVQDEMKNTLVADKNIGLEADDIKASSTYEIDLHVCGHIQKIPDGSYMQVGFGFPAGYGPDDAGVTFTVYHYTRNPDGTIKSVDEVPCVVTECGIIATVRSFSPFMICAVDATKVAVKKNIYAKVDGVGGSIDDTAIKTVDAAGVSYQITVDSGYTIDKVLLNGADVAAKMDGEKKLKIENADLNDGSNVLEVSFIAERVKTYNETNGITVAEPKFVVTKAEVSEIMSADKPDDGTQIKPDDGNSKPVENEGKKKNNTGLIVGVTVAAVAAVGGVAAVVIILMKKKKAAKQAPKEENKDTENK